MEEDLEVENGKYQQPEIQKNFSNSSDLFAPSPTENRGNKRSKEEEEDDVFGNDNYKRFKN